MYVDTSVIVRYLTGDDPARSRAAAIVIETQAIRAISVISLLEAAHVLRWLGAWRDGTADSIGDALIAASMSSTQAEAIATFDRRFPVGDWTVLSDPAS